MTYSDRRDFLKVGLGLAGAVCGLAPRGEAADRKDDPATVIDTHVHFFDPTRPQGVPWPNKKDQVLYRPCLPKHLQALPQPLKVTGTVVVEASPWVEDNQWVLDLAKDEPLIVGLVGHLVPGEDEYRKHLERFVKNPLFRGIRIAHARLRKGFEQPRFMDDLKLLATHDLQLDVNGGPDMPADVARLAQLIPDLRTVINHCANVPIDGKEVKPEWLAGMQAAAKHRQVYCKVSALVEGAGRQGGEAPAQVRFYQPVLDALWNGFGEDRLIYGSNWPVSERYATYATLQSIVRDYFQAKGKTATEKFFWRNSLAAYKWVKR